MLSKRRRLLFQKLRSIDLMIPAGSRWLIPRLKTLTIKGMDCKLSELFTVHANCCWSTSPISGFLASKRKCRHLPLIGIEPLLLLEIECKLRGDGAADWVDGLPVAEVDISLENCIGSSNDYSATVYLIHQHFLIMSIKFLLPWLFLICSAALSLPGHASKTNDLFRDKLEKACLKIDQKVICECYARAVASRYGDQQLASISQLLKDKEANQMFLVIHANEGIACRSRVGTS